MAVAIYFHFSATSQESLHLKSSARGCGQPHKHIIIRTRTQSVAKMQSMLGTILLNCFLSILVAPAEPVEPH